MERLALACWGWAAQRPALYALGTRIGARMLAWLGGSERLIHRLPLAAGWMTGRDLPAPEGETFRDRYAARGRKD
jgi:L-lactate dehydrogenase complex protein LldF